MNKRENDEIIKRYTVSLLKEGIGHENIFGKYTHPKFKSFMYWEAEKDLANRYGQAAVDLALRSIEEEHGPNGIDAWHSGAIDLDTFTGMVRDGVYSEKFNSNQGTRLAVDIYLRRYKSDLKVDKRRIMQDISTHIQQQSDIPNWQKITIQPYGDTLTNQSSVLEIVISAPQGTNPSNVEQAITDSIEGEYRYDVYQY